MSALTLLLIALAAVAWLTRMVPVGLVAARMLQIEEYEHLRLLRWGMARAWVVHRSVLIGFGVASVALVLTAATVQGSSLIAAGWLVASVGGALTWSWTPPKRDLVMTARMRRLFGSGAFLATLAAAGVAVLLALGQWIAAGVLVCVVLMPATVAAPLLLVVADQALRPVETLVRQRYLRAARAQMKRVAPRVVAVAGSYGKTSTKHILAKLLEDQVETLPTRKSFNTLMGVTRVINEDLTPSHRLFIVEMDAYAPGEIRSMCELVHPSCAIVTSVGPQHLERFRTMDRIADALYEVVQSLPSAGAAFIHAGEPNGVALADRAQRDGRSVVRYGLAATGAELDVIADAVHADGSGSHFRWSWPELGLERHVTIPLLGSHQVLNVTVALAVVHRLGHDLDAAVAAATALQPVEHRLEVMRTGGPVRVIDDSYNANPVGVHNALDVLATLNGGAKLLVTPGLVELGPLEDAENRRYGEHAASVCDHVIVMRARTEASLLAGLRAGGLSDDRIHLATSLSEATALIGRLARPGDTVLFANDLPDTYLASG